MAESVLVAYASLHGSTQEVAEAVAQTLSENGLRVDCKPAGEVRDIEEYDAVVLGAAIYIGRLHRHATRFLARHREALQRKPTAVFALGPFHNEEKEWNEVRAQLDNELAKFPWFQPVAREIFGGKFDPAKLSFPYKWLPVLRAMPASDIRDWAAIRGWTSHIAEQLNPALVETPT